MTTAPSAPATSNATDDDDDDDASLSLLLPALADRLALCHTSCHPKMLSARLFSSRTVLQTGAAEGLDAWELAASVCGHRQAGRQALAVMACKTCCTALACTKLRTTIGQLLRD